MELENAWLIGLAIMCLTILESIYLIKGHNGIVFNTVLMLIAGLVGYAVPSGIGKVLLKKLKK